MNSTICTLFIDFSHGFIDSIRGLAFIRQLDQDDEYEEISSPAPPRRTVLQQRREKSGQKIRPPEKVVRHKERVWKRILQCAGVNIAIIVLLQLLSYFFSLFLGLFTDENYGTYVTTVFCLPIFLFTRIVMALWFSDIAGACHRQLRLDPPPSMDFRYALADTLLSLLLGFIFLIQGFLAGFIPVPVVSTLMMFIHATLLNSMYSFEYFWASRSVGLQKRVKRIETRWAYFVGFGTPLTIATSISSSMLINGCIFATLFPFFIISSFKADWDRQYKNVDYPQVQIFWLSNLINNKLSIIVSSYLLPS